VPKKWPNREVNQSALRRRGFPDRVRRRGGLLQESAIAAANFAAELSQGWQSYGGTAWLRYAFKQARVLRRRCGVTPVQLACDLFRHASGSTALRARPMSATGALT